YVLTEITDGSKVDGIITGLDHENVYFAVPIDSTDQFMNHDESGNFRQFGGYGGYGPGYGTGYGHPGYGYGHGYPGHGYPGRRFRRLVLPLAAITALTLLPWY